MSKNIVVTLIIVGLICLGIIGYFILVPADKKIDLQNSSNEKQSLSLNQKNEPSTAFIDYSDPAGFAFSYPDNVSITKNEAEDAYADLELFSKDVSGSLSLTITDSKFKNLDEWVKNTASSTDISREVTLGTLKAKEIKSNDRIFLAALDQGILFNIELPRIEEAFWTKVYEKLLSSFSFVSPETATTSGSSGSSDVSFEGEEVVE